MARNSQLAQEQTLHTETEQPVRTGEQDGAPERGRVSPEPAPGPRPTRDRDLSRREKAGNYFREHSRAGALVLLVVALLVAVGVYLWIQHITWESTDDAQIQGHIMPLSTRINGNIQQVNVEEGQRVKAGDVLIAIDPTDYQVALARAQADLQDADAQAHAA